MSKYATELETFYWYYREINKAITNNVNIIMVLKRLNIFEFMLAHCETIYVTLIYYIVQILILLPWCNLSVKYRIKW